MNLNARLNTRDITDTINRLKWYESHLQYKLEQFVSELAKVGIEVAKANTYVEVDDEYKNMGDAIEFTKSISGVDGVTTCILTATGIPFVKEWQGGSAQVNPLLMSEFGSGWRAIEGHQGTFPNQHVAFMRPWHWVDTSGTKHESYGSEPSRPLFKAVEEMRNQIQTVAAKVFSE